MLFFDEADAIFGKRSEVRDAHDRYANIESAYLLQRLETFDGLAVLATNLRANIDEAFTRRLDAIVDFPLPDAEPPPRAVGPLPRDRGYALADVDLDFLADSFELAGACAGRRVRPAGRYPRERCAGDRSTGAAWCHATTRRRQPPAVLPRCLRLRVPRVPSAPTSHLMPAHPSRALREPILVFVTMFDYTQVMIEHPRPRSCAVLAAAG